MKNLHQRVKLTFTRANQQVMSKPSKTNRIQAAAVRINGRVFIGRSHAQIIRKVESTTFIRPVSETEMGFVDASWKFEDRVTAMKIAIDAKQVDEPMDPKELCSQDIISRLIHE